MQRARVKKYCFYNAVLIGKILTRIYHVRIPKRIMVDE